MSQFENDPLYEHKFFVVKDSILQEELDFLKENGDEAYHNVLTFLENIASKARDKEYLVVNQDEPYAEAVWNIIKNNTKKEIVAFIGRAGSGKDYQCSLLQNKGYKKLAFADSLRKIAFNSIGLTFQEGMEQYDYLKANDCIIITLQDKEEIKMNFRTLLELMGTQGIRRYDNDFWCKCLIKELKENKYRKVCISDMRFINEYNYLKEFAEENGYKFTVIFCNYRSDRYQENNDHDSAKMGNYFATHGYEDLQAIKEIDMDNYVREGGV